MPKFFVKKEQLNGNIVNIVGQDVNHIKNVLRLEKEDEIHICNLDIEETYLCKIVNFKNEGIECEILKKDEEKREPKINLTIIQGLPKAEKMELIIEKSTELGVKEIIPLKLNRCIVKFDSKTEIKKIDRWQKIAETASKQSKRDAILKINNIINLNNVCNLIPSYDIVLVAYENEKENSLKKELVNLKNSNIENLKIAVIIGPEGGFEEEEIAALEEVGVKAVSLGRRILRTETAPIAIATAIMYEFDELQ